MQACSAARRLAALPAAAAAAAAPSPRCCPATPAVAQRQLGSRLVCRGVDPKYERSLVGEDFGARDPTVGELASNFSDKVLGNFDTEHIIKPPEKLGEIMGLKNKKCVPCEGGAQALPDAEVNRLRLQAPGWRVGKNKDGVDCITHEWKVRNFKAGLELFQRVGALAEEERHHPDLHLVGYNLVTAELSTHAANGLTENDFILAAKINELDLADLLPKRKPKFWA
eukprot:scaffold3.g6532.t1